MADLGLMDIVALAKAGYKKKDIDAILQDKGNNSPAPAPKSDPEPKEPTSDPEPKEPTSDPEPKEPIKEGNEPQKVPANDPIPGGNGNNKPAPDGKDYKKLYEELQKSSADMQTQIKELQSRINSKDYSNSSGKDTTMDDLMASFKNFS